MSSVREAVAALRAGKLVAFPTETVYGLGANAENVHAVRKIFAAKGRPPDHPLIVHVAAAGQIDEWAVSISDDARILAAVAWPGPLTLVLHRHPRIPDVVTGGRPTVGLRVPSHLVAHELLTQFGGGVAAPSANRFGHVSPTCAAHVLADLGDRVDVIVDGGMTDIGVESTIVDVTLDPPMLLRHGAVTVDMITAILGRAPQETAGPSRASGMLASHYAPRCQLVLVDSRAHADSAADGLYGTVDVLAPGDDLSSYARGLYGWLRDADNRGVDTLIVVRPPAVGLGLAIDDRLRKAAANR